jgi:hypothetical protein
MEPPRLITISHELDAPRLRQLLLDEPWNVIHLFSYVDPVLGDTVVGDVGPGALNRFGLTNESGTGRRFCKAG